ncbi:MAG: hypothetical protein STSR0001_16600 [Methanothrix sp.]
MIEDQLLAEALRPLQDRISFLEATIAQLKEENVAMAATQAHFIENQEIQLRLIKQLREGVRREPQPMQNDRAEILRALLVANGGKMLAKDARKKMHLSKERFSNLLLICDFIERRPYHLDRRQDVIILKSESVRPNC